MKIIIVGGGVGGVASYLALQKYLYSVSGLSIKIYESHSDPSATTSFIGGGLGLAPNGLRAISSFCPVAAERIQATGFPNHAMTFRNSKGVLLGKLAVGKGGRYGCPQMMLSRAAVHEALLAEVPEGAIEWGKRVCAVIETVEGVEVGFEDGAVEKADLVIGADGVRSMVREAVVGCNYPARYEGLSGVGGFLPLSSLPLNFRSGLSEDPVTLAFGPHGFFAYSPCVPISSTFPPDAVEGDRSEIMWWSTYEVDPPPSRNLPVKDIRRQLIERHGSWKSPYDSESDGQVFSSIIEFACGSDSDTNFPDKHLLVLPTYTTPELPHWCSSSGKIVLLGDACHAMPPHSGQGVSCAVEDSLAIALLLEHFLSQRPTSPSTGSLDLGGALVNTAKAYEEIRMPRVRSILNWARKVGDQKRKMGKIQEWVRDWIMWIICKLPESIMHDGLFGYDVEAEVRRYTSQN